MTKRTTTDGDPCYKVRVGTVTALDVAADWITDDRYPGDTLGYTDWPAAIAITWRSTAPERGAPT